MLKLREQAYNARLLDADDPMSEAEPILRKARAAAAAARALEEEEEEQEEGPEAMQRIQESYTRLSQRAAAATAGEEEDEMELEGAAISLSSGSGRVTSATLEDDDSD